MIDGRIALVTGAGSGIGRAIAQAFADAGLYVIAHDQTAATQAFATAIGGTFIHADLADAAQVQTLADKALAVAGRVDVLVNNAGFQHIAPIAEFPDDVWQRMIQVLLTAPFQLIKQLVPPMQARGWGRIINVASIHGLVASPYKAAYISAKHGLIGLTKAVAVELGTAGITANAICPAYVRTPLVEAQIADQARTRNLPEAAVVAEVMLEPAAVKRLIEPHEVAALAVFLASDQASMITGSSYTIDGGWTAR